MQKKLGKSEARARFLPLMQQVASGSGPIEITDRGQVAAVLMSHKEYLFLLARAGVNPKPGFSAVGTLEIVGDLDEARRELSREMLEAVLKSAEDL